MAIALSFTTEPSLITPVYNDVIFVIDSNLDITDVESRFEVTVNIDGNLRYFNLLPDSSGDAEFNLSKILQQFSSSYKVRPSAFLFISNEQVLTYTITVKAINSTETNTIVSATKHTFNGAVQDNKDFDFNDYLFNSLQSGNLLNNYVEKVNTRLTDDFTLQYLNGTFGSILYTLTSITVDVYYKSGAMLTAVVPLAASTGIGTAILDCSPARIQTETLLTIDSTVEKYTIRGTNSEFSAVTVYLKENDTRFNNSTRLTYINHLGAMNYISFYLGFENDLDIKKSIYQNDDESKVYDIDSSESLALISDYMTESESIAFADFWESPVLFDQNDRNVILTTTKIRIKRDRNGDLISYIVPFDYAKKRTTIKK